MKSLIVTSMAFNEGAMIPIAYTCDGEDISPELVWADTPLGTISIAVIVEDPDAPGGVFIHWVLYNLPGGTASLMTGVPKVPHLPDGSEQGMNSFGRSSYRGPCPPKGQRHRYFFRVFALDQKVNIRGSTTAEHLKTAMKGHVLAEGYLMGTYQRVDR
ncbi:YbhB/YbcL family Raf kinase inhibitor-like protein [Methanosphaerula palustris]|uniref:PEBP family protein n=1 Tax=Methanosphaerula palustris (strain ATCC BAA-1556 / DSM 19958 / E1-9c) TaxID=521011 RepID=B8GJ08_METPE|nr:YbhB/YbcL family Raf kinase inhibitor-like protein [Methanosphaerula palustris]ACL15581.1 PEBP family protein [Methanosphaerula palustris E1-9c]